MVLLYFIELKLKQLYHIIDNFKWVFQLFIHFKLMSPCTKYKVIFISIWTLRKENLIIEITDLLQRDHVCFCPAVKTRNLCWERTSVVNLIPGVLKSRHIANTYTLPRRTNGRRLLNWRWRIYPDGMIAESAPAMLRLTHPLKYGAHAEVYSRLANAWAQGTLHRV